MRLFLIKTILKLCAHLPMTVIHGLGVLIGWGLIMVPNRIFDNTKTNVRLCFPERPPAEQHRLVCKSLTETGKTIIETSALWFRPGPQALQLIRAVDGLGLVENAIEKGNGVILATPHLGAWEAAGLYGAAMFNMTCLYRPLRITELEDLVRTARNRLGANFVPTSAPGIRKIYKALGQGGVVAMLPDQEPQSGSGTFAPFFGIPAWTMVLLARLAAKTGAPIIFAYCERLAWGRGYHLHFSAAPAGIYSSDTNTAATAINQAIEQLIRNCPTQYQWSYRRFRTRPAGESSFYKPGHHQNLSLPDRTER
jgi:KDO2-lipid IV(A) lauroyltransferase